MEPDGYLLIDCHAEILARRSLQRTLMKEIMWHLRGDQTKKAFILSMSAGADRKFSIAEGIRIHMYVSEAPCGDASILVDEHEIGAKVHWTGAKLA